MLEVVTRFLVESQVRHLPSSLWLRAVRPQLVILVEFKCRRRAIQVRVPDLLPPTARVTAACRHRRGVRPLLFVTSHLLQSVSRLLTVAARGPSTTPAGSTVPTGALRAGRLGVVTTPVRAVVPMDRSVELGLTSCLRPGTVILPARLRSIGIVRPGVMTFVICRHPALVVTVCRLRSVSVNTNRLRDLLESSETSILCCASCPVRSEHSGPVVRSSQSRVVCGAPVTFIFNHVYNLLVLFYHCLVYV